MKARRIWILAIAFPLVALAADMAPPHELLENLDFFQNFDLVKDKQFIAHANTDDVAEVLPSTSPVVEGGLPHDTHL